MKMKKNWYFLIIMILLKNKIMKIQKVGKLFHLMIIWKLKYMKNTF